MPPRLLAIGGAMAGVTIPLTEPEIRVGSDAANTLRLVDASVSAWHCVLTTSDGSAAIRDLDSTNPSFVNGMPAGARQLQDGDEIQIGGSVFVLSLAEPDPVPAGDSVRVSERSIASSLLTMSREEVLAGDALHERLESERQARDLEGLIRITAAVSSIRGLVVLERPLLELIADVVPAARGAIVLGRELTTDTASAVGWHRDGSTNRPVEVSRALVERVLRQAIGLLTHDRRGLAAPLVAFDDVIGAILLESDAQAEPFDAAHLRFVMAAAGIAATAYEHARRIESLEGAHRSLQAQINVAGNMVGDSHSIRDVSRRIARIAPTDSTVLITGESGTGKELVARAIHRNSSRGARPFVAINCAAIVETLLETELFGHEKGAFTGAVVQKKGKLETAAGGTVFLDEIGELSLALQAKLLRVLEDREFDRVGGTRRVQVDFRLLAATNRDLEAAVESGDFRRDLFYRLNVVSLKVPPLRERRDDIPLLATWFLRRHAHRTGRLISGFSPEAMSCLTAHDWAGNVRELENAIEHAVVLGSSRVILPEDLPDAIAEGGTSPVEEGKRPFHEAVKQTKKELIVRAVQQAEGNYNSAARLLGLHPNYLHRLIKTLDLKAAVRAPAAGRSSGKSL